MPANFSIEILLPNYDLCIKKYLMDLTNLPNVIDALPGMVKEIGEIYYAENAIGTTAIITNLDRQKLPIHKRHRYAFQYTKVPQRTKIPSVNQKGYWKQIDQKHHIILPKQSKKESDA